MPRPERELGPYDGPVRELAEALRALRREAGNPVYRELARRTRYSSTTLSDAAGGWRLPALPVVLAYVEACGGDRAEWQERWEKVARELAGESEHDAPPYRGLSSFQVEDADRFFGRDALIEELLRRLAAGRFLAVFGASGSGKSSVLRAGVIPAVVRDGVAGAKLRPVLFTPGSTPCAELERHLSETGEKLIVVDQFEELFTLCADRAERTRFVERLIAEASTPGGETRVVLGVRADFYAACGQFGALLLAMADRTVLVGPMTDGELRRAVTKPATLAGLTVERALVTKVLAEAGGQPGALPMVSHALLETWRHRQGATLTLAGYEAAGGVTGAIARTAEGVYGELDEGHRRVARQVLQRLTALGQGTEDTRRVVLRTELDLEGAEPVIESLVQARLVVAHDDVIEVAHEALIGAWPRLRGWLTDDREALRTHRQLIEAAALWQSLGRDEGMLFRDTRLAMAREWAEGEGRGGELTAVERDFLDLSIAAESAARSAASRRGRQLKVLAGGLATLLVLALVASVTAGWQWRMAVTERQQAVSRQFATQALSAASRDVPEAMRLSAEAYGEAPTVEARGALLSVASRRQYSGRLDHAGLVKDVAFTPDGATLAVAGNDGQIALWDVARRVRRKTLVGHGNAVRALALSKDGRSLVSGGLDGSVIVWDMANGVEARRLRQPAKDESQVIDAVAISPDGATIAALGKEKRTLLWRASDGVLLRELVGHGGIYADLDFSPDSKSLVTAGDDGSFVVWDVATGVQRSRVQVSTEQLSATRYSPDGATIAASGDDRAITLWKVATGERKVLRGHNAAVRSVAFSPDGSWLVSAGGDGEAGVWDVTRGKRLNTLTGHSSNLYAVAVSPDGATIAGGSRDRTVLLWDRASMPLADHVNEVAGVAVAARGGTLASAGSDATVVLWDAATGSAKAVLRDTATQSKDMLADVAVSPDGALVAAASFDRTARIWDTTTGVLLHTLRGHTEAVLSVAYHPGGRFLATGSNDNSVGIWDPVTGATVTTIRPGTKVRSVSFSADGRLLLCAGPDGGVTLWDVPSWTKRAEFHDDEGLVSAAISRDGAVVAVGRASGAVALWDTATRHIIDVLRAHTSSVNALAFSPDGRLLATGGIDASAKLWSLDDHQLWATLSGSLAAINDIAWSPDSRNLYTAGGDQVVTRWHTDPDEAYRQICTDIVRTFPTAARPQCDMS
jgi:WD40 repeat protein